MAYGFFYVIRLREDPTTAYSKGEGGIHKFKPNQSYERASAVAAPPGAGNNMTTRQVTNRYGRTQKCSRRVGPKPIRHQTQECARAYIASRLLGLPSWTESQRSRSGFDEESNNKAIITSMPVDLHDVKSCCFATLDVVGFAEPFLLNSGNISVARKNTNPTAG